MMIMKKMEMAVHNYARLKLVTLVQVAHLTLLILVRRYEEMVLWMMKRVVEMMLILFQEMAVAQTER